MPDVATPAQLDPPAYFELLPRGGSRKTGAKIRLLPSTRVVHFRNGVFQTCDPELRDLMTGLRMANNRIYRLLAYNPHDKAAKVAAAETARVQEVEDLRAEVAKLEAEKLEGWGMPKEEVPQPKRRRGRPRKDESEKAPAPDEKDEE